MVDLKELYNSNGLRACVVEKGSIVSSYLLTDEEIEHIDKLTKVLECLPDNFEYGLIVYSNFKVCVFKLYNDTYIVSPVSNFNLGNIINVYKNIKDNLGVSP